tara:strand:- start:4971 stop:5957 length:987 start_codon:yes stop_codon:yes gene_type:complete
MDKDKLQELANSARDTAEYISSEEGCKTSLVLPFLTALGYDVFNPKQICPELLADFGVKKRERVDYAVMYAGKPVVLIECKACSDKLGSESVSQLFRYFTTTTAKFGWLTNGIKYLMFTDIETANRMDVEPFFCFNLLSHTDEDIAFLSKFAKGRLNSNPRSLLKLAKKKKQQYQILSFARRVLSGDPIILDVLKDNCLGDTLSGMSNSELKRRFSEYLVREALEEANSKLDPYNIEKELQASLPKLLPKGYKPEVKYRLTKSSVYAEIDGDKSKQLLRIYVMGSELKLQVPEVVSGSITLDRTSDIASYGKDICARANTLIPKEKKA